MKAVTQTPYQAYREQRERLDALYEQVVEKFFRLTIGPSGNQGVYLKSERPQEQTISNIDEREARFIVAALLRIYGDGILK